MTQDCLASTGGSSLTFIAIGVLAILAGLGLVRARRVIASALLVTFAMTSFVAHDATSAPAFAVCSPDATALIQGTFRVSGAHLEVNELPQLTATKDTTVLSATWGAPIIDGSDTVTPFAFSSSVSGDWTFEISESPATSFEFATSDLSFVVNSSRMLTGGPFNAATPSPVTVSQSGLKFEIVVTRS